MVGDEKAKAKAEKHTKAMRLEKRVIRSTSWKLRETETKVSEMRERSCRLLGDRMVSQLEKLWGEQSLSSASRLNLIIFAALSGTRGVLAYRQQ
jgi:hypothetical protein